MEILIVILVFVLPVLSVIFDKKKRKGVPRVKSKRIILPGGQFSPEAAETQAKRKASVTGHYMSTTVNPKKPASPVKGDEARTRQAGPVPAVPADMPAQPEPGGGTVLSRQPGFSPAVATACTAAGTPTSRQADAQTVADAFVSSARSTRRKDGNAAGTEKKEYSEKQKLIIYSEILKPKFDE